MHMNGHIRNAFGDWFDGYLASDTPVSLADPVEVGSSVWTISALLGKLWNCTDILPGGACDELDLPIGSTYARAVRHLKGILA